MKSRIALIREALGKTPESFASLLNIHPEWLFMAENTLDSFDIPDSIISDISARYQLPKEFILGFPYEVTKPLSDWHPDERQDYLKANPKMKIMLTAHFGYCKFSDQMQSSS